MHVKGRHALFIFCDLCNSLINNLLSLTAIFVLVQYSLTPQTRRRDGGLLGVVYPTENSCNVFGLSGLTASTKSACKTLFSLPVVETFWWNVSIK